MLNYCNIDVIPHFLGGENTTPLWQDKGPWNKYEIVEASGPKSKVGIRLKGQSVTDDVDDKIVFTPDDLDVLLGCYQNSSFKKSTVSYRQLVQD